MGSSVLELLTTAGPLAAVEACRRLGVSQPTFSRMVRACPGEVLRVGRSRSTRYAAHRRVAGIEAPVSVYEIRPPGEAPRLVARLHPVHPGFCVEVVGEVLPSFVPDLPWVLQDLRPSGFLGRLVPLRHPDLDVPSDVRLWTADHVLRYVTRHGWDLPGAFVVGDRAFEAFVERSERPQNVVQAAERGSRYPRIAVALLTFGVPGSSAAGEQPKFLATRDDGDRQTPVLVKFSPPAGDPQAQRIADLLVAEHVAHAVLREQGLRAPASAVVQSEGRTFLEVERFDRVGTRHRRGVVSLLALDAGLLGSDQSSWTRAVEQLAARGVVLHDDVERVRWLETFGRLIGNTDQHFGNLSFYLDGTEVTTLAPVYDMLPMHYHPRQGELPTEAFRLPALGPREASVAPQAIAATVRFWEQVSVDSRISEAFRHVAEADARRVAKLALG